ncbi:MAG TPA: hypothetical protein VMT81_02700, partial [Candidatus Paceibacterota bacterium]|nr:hypothetical protein [Candidatus Paceibacterota bacterium]
MLSDEIKRVAGLPICSSEVATRYVARAGEGNLTRDEDPATHFCVYFLPYNPATKQIFMVHHKKAGIWLAPGGHIDRGESLHG